jgi:hypothetical protein
MYRRCVTRCLAALLAAGVVALTFAPIHEHALATDEPHFTFGTVGDIGANANASAVLQAIGRDQPDLVVSTGDLSQEVLPAADWCRFAKDQWNAGLGLPPGALYGETFPFAFAVGNHDRAEVATFASCLPDRVGAVGSPHSGYPRDYYIDYPPEAPLARFIVTSPGIFSNYGSGSSQLQWMSDRIDSARAAGIPWIIAVNHLNYISTGTKTDEIGSAFFDLLVGKQVDLILQGHNHTYQRSKHLAHGPGCTTVPAGSVNPSCIAADGTAGMYAKGHGSVLLINGTGGFPMYDIAEGDPRAGYFAVAYGRESGSFHGYVSIDVTPETLESRFVHASGRAFSDTFRIATADAPQPPPPPSGGVVYREDWSQASGSSWPGVWATSSGAGGVVDVAEGAGWLRVVDQSNSYARAAATGVEALTDTDVLVAFRWNQTTAAAYHSIYVRGSGGWANAYRPRNGYGLEFASHSTGVALDRVVNGSRTVLAFIPGQRTTELQWVRFRVEGDELLVRLWVDGQPEPTTWSYRGSATTSLPAGHLYTSLVRSSSNAGPKTITINELTLSHVDDGLPPPPSDTSPPTAPGDLQASASAAGTEVSLSWSAADDDVGVVGYRVVRDGQVLPGTVTGTTWMDTSVQPGSTYVYRVRAFDAAGNVGPDSDAVTITTPQPPPSGGVVYREDWSQASGSSWPGVWATSSGRVVDQSNSYARAAATGVEALTDTDVLVAFRWNQTTAAAYHSIYVRGSGGWANAYRPRNGYGLEFASHSTGVALDRVVNGSRTVLAFIPGQRTTELQWVRFRVEGDELLVRLWVDGQPEPTTWSYRGSATTSLPAGHLYTSLVRSSSNAGPKTITINELTLSHVDDGLPPPPSDTSPPTAPGDLQASASAAGTEVSLSWSAADDDVGVVGYRVVRDGQVLPGTVTGTTWMDTSVQPGSTYVYRVRAFDAAGNVGPDSDAVTITTPQPPPSGGVVYREDWSQASGSSWPGVWATSSGAGGVVDVAEGAGWLRVVDQSNSYARAAATGVEALTDTDVLVAFRWNQTTAAAYHSIYVRGSGGWANAYRPRNGYGLEFASHSTGVALDRVVNGSRTVLAFIPGQRTTELQWVRFRVEGDELLVRLWVDGQPEPTTWSYRGSATTSLPAGHLYTSLVRSSSNAGPKTITINELTLSHVDDGPFRLRRVDGMTLR